LIIDKKWIQCPQDELEKFVADLPKESQEKIEPMLKGRNRNSTYHELIVGNMIKRLGYQLEYEKQIGGKTPDWYVHPMDEIPAFIVEVFTDNISADMASRLQQKYDLSYRLGQISIGVEVYIRYDEDYRDELILNQKFNNQSDNYANTFGY